SASASSALLLPPSPLMVATTPAVCDHVHLPVQSGSDRILSAMRRGYTVLEAATAEEALETLRDKSLEVDVFVTDVVMPGMDGPSWVRIALQDRPNVRVIFVSGYAEDALSENQSRIPNSVFLPKPFSLNDLTATVQAQF
ncbi:MAG: response regulator, partial [Rhodobacterales bacterium]